MASRYETLNVSLHTPRKTTPRLSKTIEVSEQSDNVDNNSEKSQKVNKFKELYFKNQKLRKELKALNEKLNEKLQKLRLPSVKKKAMSVDLDKPPNPPTKAQQRQLQNAYKQVAMYKKQVQSLKGKQQHQQNYQKLRNLENMVGYADYEIAQVQEQLKSIKNVQKMQAKEIQQKIENAQTKQRMQQYQSEKKRFKQKIRELQQKSKKREQQFKKQQAYLVALENKRRNYLKDGDEQEPEKVPATVNNKEYQEAKKQYLQSKNLNQVIGKKVQQIRLDIKKSKLKQIKCQENIKERQEQIKTLNMNVQSFTRLLKDLQAKKYEQTGIAVQNKQESKAMLKLQEIEDQDDDSAEQPQSQRQSSPRHSSPRNSEVALSKLSKQASSRPHNSDLTPSKHSKSPSSHPHTQNLRKTVNASEDREWKGNNRKVSRGYMTPTDTPFHQNGTIVGLKVYLDENKYLTGIAPILIQNGAKVQVRPIGNVTNLQLKWQLQQGDVLSKISISFSSEGYLGEIVLNSKNGFSAQFGVSYPDKFHFALETGENFSGIFGGIRKLGQDIRITEIGFWISKQ